MIAVGSRPPTGQSPHRLFSVRSLINGDWILSVTKSRTRGDYFTRAAELEGWKLDPFWDETLGGAGRETWSEVMAWSL